MITSRRLAAGLLGSAVRSRRSRLGRAQLACRCSTALPDRRTVAQFRHCSRCCGSYAACGCCCCCGCVVASGFHSFGYSLTPAGARVMAVICTAVSAAARDSSCQTASSIGTSGFSKK